MIGQTIFGILKTKGQHLSHCCHSPHMLPQSVNRAVLLRDKTRNEGQNKTQNRLRIFQQPTVRAANRPLRSTPMLLSNRLDQRPAIRDSMRFASAPKIAKTRRLSAGVKSRSLVREWIRTV